MNRRLYLGQVGLLFSATAIAQLINFASYPLLARTYDSVAFGYFSVFVSAALVIGPLSCGRFDIVVQAAPHSQRYAALRLATWISAMVSIVSAIGYAFFAPESGAVGGWLYSILFGLSVFLLGFGFSGTAYLIKHEAYRLNGMAIVTRGLMTVVPQLLFFLVLPDARGLILGFFFGILFHSMVVAHGVRRLGIGRGSWRKYGMLARRYRQYPLFDVPSTFLSMFSLYAANFFLLDLYGAREVGYFAFAFRLAALPMALLAASLSEVFFQKAAQSFRSTGGYWNPLRFNLVIAGGLAVVIFAATLLFAHWAVDIYLGSKWGPVANVLIIIAPMMAARFVFVTISAAPLVTGRTGWLLAANALLALVMIFVFALAKLLGLDFATYLSMSSLGMAFLYLMLIAAITITAYRHYREDSHDQSARSSAGEG
jgi:lipopolysaccharide exporter